MAQSQLVTPGYVRFNPVDLGTHQLILTTIPLDQVVASSQPQFYNNYILLIKALVNALASVLSNHCKANGAAMGFADGTIGFAEC